MEFQDFVRRPFKVEAVRITEENFDQIASMIGEAKVDKKGDKYIVIDKRIIPNMPKAHIGWWVTRFNDNLRCYANKVFNEQFIEYSSDWENWFKEEEKTAS